MSPDAVVAVCLALVVLFVMLMVRAPVAIALGMAGTVGLITLRGWQISASTLATAPFQSTARYALVVIPMFTLMGIFATRGGLAEEVYRVSYRLLRRLPGGLALASIGACAGFAAVSGSSNATAATVGKVAVGEMRRYGYNGGYSAGVVAAAGTLGLMIPPSIGLVLYGIIAGESIAAILVAGIVPGVISALIYAVAVTGHARFLGDRIGMDRQREAVAAARTERLDAQAYRALFKVAFLFLLVMGGIYMGVFTATEAAALGALAALLLLIPSVRKTGIRRRLAALAESVREGVSVTSFLFLIVIGASIFTYFLVSAGVPSAFSRWVIGLDIPPTLIVLLLIAAMIPLGMFLDPISIMLITIPLAHPVITELGYSGIWFGVIVIKAIEIGLITPPVGLNVFILTGVTRVPVEQVFRGIMWFLPLDIATLLLIFAVPELATWLPGILRG
jgi:C4-dicarboxylate transporter, DctM subunit